nr:polyprenyl synthetase family protein [Acidobacteriota bacterium]
MSTSFPRRAAARPPADANPLALAIVPLAEIARVRAAFSRLLPVGASIESRLRGVLDDTLAHPGSLVRAQMAFGIATRLGLAPGPAMDLAIAVEYFHAASLIFDDMPAMDDAAVRRGRPCPHLVHGEAAATLGALALITRAYEMLWGVLGGLPARRRARAAALVAECLGVAGILDGQSRDVHFGRRGAPVRAIERVAAAKTVPLLRLAIVLPALAAGAGERALRELERLSAAWGLGYQILDDFKDCLLSEREAGKTTEHDAKLGRPN